MQGGLRAADRAGRTGADRGHGRPHAPRPAATSTSVRLPSCEGSTGRLLVIPGNHDIPYTFPARFTRPLRRVRAPVGERRAGLTAPTVSTSSASTRCGPGGTSRAGSGRSQIARTAELLGRAPEDALKVVALHHHLVGAPWRSRKKPVVPPLRGARGARRRRRRADPRRAHPPGGGQRAARVRGGSQRLARRHRLDRAGPRPAAAATGAARRAASTSTRRSADSLVVQTYVWRDDDWGLTATRRFPRGRSPLRIEPA